MFETRFSTTAFTTRTRQRIAGLSVAVLQAELQSGQALKAQAIRLSSGPYKTAQLQQMARQNNAGRGLYSRASPAPPINPAILNLQGGGIARGWHFFVFPHLDGTTLQLKNTDPAARFMLGTVNMIYRPLLEEVIRLESPARFRRLSQAKTKALK